MKNLTPCNEANDREIEMMVNKAMCAYANWTRANDPKRFFFKKNVSESEREAIKAARQSEYEATVRCIAMFVKESLYAIQAYVIDRAESEL